MTSAAEAKLDARIRPEITVLRSRTPYPKRHRPLSVVPQGPQGGQPDGDKADRGAAGDGSADSMADLVRVVMDSRAGTTGPAGSAAPKPAPGKTAPGKTAPGKTAPGKTAPERLGRRPAPEGPIRLTRRGRMVIGALVVIGAAAGATLLWLLLASQAQASSHVQGGKAGTHALTRVVVRPGQTLWSIASNADPQSDPRVIIQEIVDENSLAGISIQPGQVLWVPRG